MVKKPTLAIITVISAGLFLGTAAHAFDLYTATDDNVKTMSEASNNQATTTAPKKNAKMEKLRALKKEKKTKREEKHNMKGMNKPAKSDKPKNAATTPNDQTTTQTPSMPKY